jgi:hypothetical protein
MKGNFTDHITSSYSIMLCLLIIITMIQQTFSILCQSDQREYKTKFISKPNDYTLIENKLFINWFYQKFLQMNIKFPWSKIFFFSELVKTFCYSLLRSYRSTT